MNKFFTVIFLLFTSVLLFSQTGKPFVLGVIEEIQSKELGENRILNIYLPEGYKAEEATKYPVIYLLDGSADEDFIHIAGLVQFNSFEWINQVPKSIVVGIATVDRRRDFTFPTSIEKDQKRFASSGHSDKFIAFIEKELQPFIDKKYKTTASKTIMGQSLGGLLETEILLKKPTLFNHYVIVSPSIWWNNGSILRQDSPIFQQNFMQETAVYIAVGKEGLTPTEIPRVMEVDANLLAEKIKTSKSKNIKVFFDYLPQENHGTILHPAVSNAFKFFYPKVQE
ncbi:alpha/beta hydrolase [Flavobacterium cupreum]|uniref:Alpha/beta hydrolase n=1 Tax=Flavobacterium cupreum TaxID=2133766 RepID=A0A434AAZ1_9FLAO|nr:alpha/beta hydrolase-fold protein [Flavobacterium cupreum]RUT71599.1 alpha/beta hydrolase [Flavobacterium cupreum]